MKYSCGETWEVTKQRLTNWHPFFALFPRTIGAKDGKYICAWLEWIERRGELSVDCCENWWSWEYREKQ